MATVTPTGGADQAELQARTVRKVARRLIPFLGLLYFVNYLDRTNVGFAKLTMSKDLALTETMFGLASGLFFIGYLCFEVPSNLALHRFGARRWIARIMVSWGVVASLMAFVNSAQSLYFLRVLLGIAEAGFFPGILLYLTFWFPRKERVRLIGWFLVAIPASSALGSPISSAILQYGDGLMGLEGWRLMFLLEGLPAIALGVVTWVYLPDRPANASWLATEERDWLTGTIEAEEHEVRARHGHTSALSSLANPRVICLGLVYFGIVYGLYALSFFLPTIVAGFADQFGTTFSLVQTGLIVSVPFVIGAVAMIFWSRHSDRTGERVWHVALPAALAGVSIPVALYLGSPLAVMAAVTLTAVGIFCALPVFWYLPSAFLTGAGAAAGIALINSLGNTSGFAAPYITGWLADLTGSFEAGMWVVSAVVLLAGVGAVLLKAAPAERSDAATEVPDGSVGQPSA
jgi:MFS family permease